VWGWVWTGLAVGSLVAFVVVGLVLWRAGLALGREVSAAAERTSAAVEGSRDEVTRPLPPGFLARGRRDLVADLDGARAARREVRARRAQAHRATYRKWLDHWR
jgi:hypothetical protein